MIELEWNSAIMMTARLSFVSILSIGFHFQESHEPFLGSIRVEATACDPRSGIERLKIDW